MTKKLKRSMHDKKGLAQSQLVLLVAALGLGILLLQFTKPFTSIVSAHDVIEGCKLSVALSSWQLQKDLWVMDYTFFDSPFKLDCKTLYTEITKDSINRADDKIKLSDNSNEAKEQLKEAIMRQMKECWYMFGEGKAKVQQAVNTEGTACIVCSEIILEKELMDEIRDKKKEIKLDNMYAYAASATIPPKDEKTYLGYFLENAEHKPDLAVVSKTSTGTVTLNKQYSVVFAITAMSEEYGTRPDKWFGKGGRIKANTGIVDCYLNEGGETKIAKGDDDTRAIGCKPDGTNPEGLIFGKVIDGGTDVDLLNWKNAYLVPVTGVSGLTSVTLSTYPATVRLVPTGNLASYCKRLY